MLAKPYQKTYSRFLNNKTKKLANLIHQNIIGEAPRKTGGLIKSIKLKILGLGKFEIAVDKRTKGGKYEHFYRLGTKPHIIEPRRKKALFWPGASHPVKRVKHPGWRGDDYFTRGIEKSKPDIDKAEKEIGDGIEKELLG